MVVVMFVDLIEKTILTLLVLVAMVVVLMHY